MVKNILYWQPSEICYQIIATIVGKNKYIFNNFQSLINLPNCESQYTYSTYSLCPKFTSYLGQGK